MWKNIILNSIEVLSKNEIQAIHESTLTLLEDIGIIVDSEEDRQLLQENGATIDNKKKLVFNIMYLLGRHRLGLVYI